jgi:hypothetical protein
MSLVKSRRYIVIARPAALRGEVELVPPCELGLRWQRLLVGFRTAEQIAAHGNHGLGALRPEDRQSVGGPSAPIETADDGLVDVQDVHQGDGVGGKCRRLSIANRGIGQETRRPVAAQERDDDAIALVREQRRDIDEAVNVVGPAMQEQHRGTVAGTRLGVSDVQHARIDLLDRAERGVRSRFHDRHGTRSGSARSCRCQVGKAPLRRRRGDDGTSQEVAPMGIDRFIELIRAHEMVSLIEWSRATSASSFHLAAETARSGSICHVSATTLPLRRVRM